MEKPTNEPTSAFEHMMGTSIMACSFEGGVVLGADSRTTTGAYIANRVSDKINSVTPKIYCLRSGSAADTQAIRDYVRMWSQDLALQIGEEPSVKSVANLFKMVCYEYKDALSAGIIVAGYDKNEGGEVFAIPLGGAMIKQPFAIGGSGSTYIYGYCDAHYKEGMNQNEAEKFVTESLALAMSRDGSSGGIIRLVTITKDTVTREYIPNEKLPKAEWQG